MNGRREGQAGAGKRGLSFCLGVPLLGGGQQWRSSGGRPGGQGPVELLYLLF